MRIFTSLLIVSALVATRAVAGVDAGISAYEKGNFARAASELTSGAEAGDVRAQHYLGLALRRQVPIPEKRYRQIPDPNDPRQQAVYGWISKAAVQGYAPAQRELADLLDTGFGVAPDFQLALDWLKKAVDAGDADATRRLGRWYDDGHIVAPDRAQAVALYERAKPATPDPKQQAAAAGQKQRLDTLRNIIETSRQYAEAKGLITDPRPGAEAGDALAAVELADRYASSKNAERDCAKAAEWWQRAGDLGNANGYRLLGNDLFEGRCNPQDLARAWQWFSKAAAAGDSIALSRLASLALFGHGRPADLAEAWINLKLLDSIDREYHATEPARMLYADARLTGAERQRAEAELAARLQRLAPILARRAAKETRKTIASAKGDGAPPWAYDLSLVDASGRCSQNYLGNCSYVPFETVLVIDNPQPTTLDCRLKLPYRQLGMSDFVTVERRYVLLPASSKRPPIGWITGEVDAKNSGVSCARVEKPTMEAGTCVAQQPSGANPSKFYPPALLRQGKQGNVVLAVTLPKSGSLPSSVSVETPSGIPELDAAGMRFAQSTAFLTNCPGSTFSVPLQFRIE